MPNQHITIIAWKRLSRRSELLAKALDAKLWFFRDRLPYAKAAVGTMLKILKEKPRILIVQLPQGPLLLEALFIGRLVGSKVVADVHTGFILKTNWKGQLLNVPFLKFLPAADLVIVHNHAQLNLISRKLRKKTIVVFDPWYLISNSEGEKEERSENYAVFPASFAPDEPLEEIFRSINTLEIKTKLYVTGNWKRQPSIASYASKRIVFTRYLPDEEYKRLLRNASVVIAGTKREYTTLMAAWEAVAYARPLALTKTLTLEEVFRDYAFFYDWTNSESIAAALEKALESKPRKEARKELEAIAVASVGKLEERLRKSLLF